MAIASPAPTPDDPGAQQAYWLEGLSANSQYMARLRFRNAEGVWSDPSNVATGRTTELGSLSFAVSELTTPERDGSVDLIVARSGGLLDSASVTVESVPGSAYPTRDFRGLLQVLSFPPGALADTVTLTIVDNDEVRGTRNLSLRMNFPFRTRIGTPGSVRVSIEEDDTGFRFGPGDHRAGESAGSLSIPVERVGNPNTVLSVDYETLDGTANAGLDFTMVSGSLHFDSGDTEQWIRIPLLGDRYTEGTETLLVRLYSPSLPAQLPEDPVEAYLDDDDEIVINVIPVAPVAVAEGAGTVEVGIGRFEAGVSYESVVVRYRTVFGSGAGNADGDDIVVTEGTVELADPGARVSIPVELVDDPFAEDAEAFWIEIYEPTGGATIGSRPRAEIRVQDDDPARIEFVRQPDSFLEGDGEVSLRLVRMGPGLGPIEATIVPREHTALEGIDFAAGSLRASFQEPGDTVAMSISLIDDIDREQREDFYAHMSSSSPGVSAGPDLRMWIEDDDAELTVSDLEVHEGDGLVWLAVRRWGYLHRPATVEYQRKSGSAIDGFDFVMEPGTLIFAPGDDSVGIPIEILQDEWIEPTESISIGIVNPTGATIHRQGASGVVSILDDDRIRLVFDAPDLTVSEDEEFPVIEVVREGSSLFRVVARPSGVSGAAIQGADFEILGDSLVFEPGERRRAYPLQILDDDVLEVRENFVIRLNGEYYASANVELVDDDGFGVRFQATELTFSERGSLGYARVELWGDGPAEEVLISYRTLDGTAVAGEDYFEEEGTLTLTPLYSLRDIRLRIRADDLEEGVEFFQLELTEAVGGVLTAPRVITVFIEDE